MIANDTLGGAGPCSASSRSVRSGPRRSQRLQATLSIDRRAETMADAADCLALLWQFFHFHRCHLRFAFPIRNSYPTDIPRKVPLNCQSSASPAETDFLT